MKKALITGITGQDGSYLAELLVNKGYDVHGIVRRVALEKPTNHYSRISHLVIANKITLHQATMENHSSLFEVIERVRPDEVYHLAAQSFVQGSFYDEYSTMRTNIEGTHSMLSICAKMVPHTKFYFAASSEMFGNVLEIPQTEATPFNPRSPYAISKVTGYHLARYFRNHPSINLFTACGILFNHESPRRGMEFVSRKITRTAAEIKHGLADKLVLGNPDALRDWGYAVEYVNAMWLMLQQSQPDDYVIATGETHTVREFTEEVFTALGLDPEKHIVWNDPAYVRPSEVNILIGNPAKAEEKLNWKAEVKFKELAHIMAESDLYDTSPYKIQIR